MRFRLRCFLFLISSCMFSSLAFAESITELAEKGDVVGLVSFIIGYLGPPVLLILWVVRKLTNRSKKIGPAKNVATVLLSFYDAGGKAQTIEFSKAMITIGSQQNCDVVFPNIQPLHCRIYLSTQGYFAEDLGGGIFVNSVPGSGFIQSDDILCVGNSSLRFTLNEPEGNNRFGGVRWQ